MSNKQMFTTSKDDKECGELKNIQYQTMLLNGAPENVCGKEDKVDNFEEFIDSQQKMNIYTPWSKMDKIAKLDRLNAYVESLNINLKSVQEGERLPEREKEELKTYLKMSLNRKKLQRVKEVIYDKDNGKITDIPGLMMNKKKKFTLRKEKKGDSSLKSLAPKTSKTVKKTKRVKKLTVEN